MADLSNKVVLVTGAASGIGRATATLFAKEGAKVCVVDIDQEAGGAVAMEVGGIFARADVSRPEEIQSAVDTAVGEFGRLDVAHLNAGIGERDLDVATMSRESFDRSIGINVGGVVWGTQAAVNAMTDGGAIIATASLAGLISYNGDPMYGLTKHAVVGFVRSAAHQLAKRNITINAIAPGFTRTAMLEDMVPVFEQNQFPLLDPEDVAQAVLVAASSGETGQVFICQPGRIGEIYKFRGVPGPRVEGAEGMAPPKPG